jgi:UDP:flavonoid glycosyltransferase YjiC (YdhE family)
MRVVLTSYGSTGDIEPFLALASELRCHGHAVTLALVPYFGPRVRQLGVEFVPIGPDVPAQEFTWNWLYRSPQDIAAGVERLFDDLRAACAGNDLLISSAEQPMARAVHDLTQIPYVSIRLIHPPAPPFEQSPREQIMAALVNSLRSRFKLPRLRYPLTADSHSPQLALYALSRTFLQPAPEWPAHHHVTGFIISEEPAGTPDPALMQFLAAGEPPVVVSLGSAVYKDPAALTEVLLAAIARVGCRVVVQQGWAGLAQRQQALPNVHIVDYIPHSWLFPHASCVITHGGLGTMVRSFLSGVPVIGIPHMEETAISMRYAAQLGGVGATLWHEDVSAEALADGIIETLRNPRYRAAARELGQAIVAEQGVQTARRLVEHYMATR